MFQFPRQRLWRNLLRSLVLGFLLAQAFGPWNRHLLPEAHAQLAPPAEDISAVLVSIERAWSEGDADALQKLFIEYHGLLHRLLDRRMDATVKRHFSPEDVLQNAYVSAVKSIKSRQFAGPAPFYKWLETIVLRKLVDHQRTVKRLPGGESKLARPRSDPEGSYAGLSAIVTAGNNSPSAELAKEDGLAALITSLARLSDDQRNAIRLRYLEGKTVAEVSECMDKTEPAVNGLCWRGLQKLGDLMGSISRYMLRP